MQQEIQARRAGVGGMGKRECGEQDGQQQSFHG
jgi:hypothetical protein